MNKQSFIRHLEMLVSDAGTQRALAKKLGVSSAYLHDVLRGRREPGDSILKPLKMKKVISYEDR